MHFCLSLILAVFSHGYANYYCHKKLSMKYFAFIFLFLVCAKICNAPISVFYEIVICYLASIVDIECMEIPDLCHILQIVHCIFFSKLSFQAPIFIILFGLFLSHYRLLGFGDSKLLAAFAMGNQAKIPYILLISSITCLIHKKRNSGRIPFAPYLSIGIIFSLLILT